MPGRRQVTAYGGVSALVLAVLIGSTLNPVNAQCVGGTALYERTAGRALRPNSRTGAGGRQALDHSQRAVPLPDCVDECLRNDNCHAFTRDYGSGTCYYSDINSEGLENALVDDPDAAYFQEICIMGQREDVRARCGPGRLWAFERVLDAALEQQDMRKLPEVGSRLDCMRHCLLETNFICRSATYDSRGRVCHLSGEDRHTRLEAFRVSPGSGTHYMENQCAPAPDTCLFAPAVRGATLSAPDLVVPAVRLADCQAACAAETRLRCFQFSYSSDSRSCQLGGAGGRLLSAAEDQLSALRRCGRAAACAGRRDTYEKVAGQVLKGAAQALLFTAPTGSGIGLTPDCRRRCDDGEESCPGFALDYRTQSCYRLQRNTVEEEMEPREGFNYFQKICLHVPSELAPRCSDLLWLFERLPGWRLEGHIVRRLEQVASRADCMEACLASKCRSANYIAASLQCELSMTDRRHHPGDLTRSSSSDYLENQCQTEDKPSERCPFSPTRDKYPRYVDESLGLVDSEGACQRRCETHSRFVCRSFAFSPSALQCLLSGDDRVSAGEGVFLSQAHVTFYQRDCQQAQPQDHHRGNTNKQDTRLDLSEGTSNIPRAEAPSNHIQNQSHARLDDTRRPLDRRVDLEPMEDTWDRPSDRRQDQRQDRRLDRRLDLDPVEDPWDDRRSSREDSWDGQRPPLGRRLDLGPLEGPWEPEWDARAPRDDDRRQHREGGAWVDLVTTSADSDGRWPASDNRQFRGGSARGGWREEQSRNSGGGWREEQSRNSGGGWREQSRDSGGGWRKETSWDSDGGWRESSRDSGRGWKEQNWDSGDGWRESSRDSGRGWKEPSRESDRGWRESSRNPGGWREEQSRNSGGGWRDSSRDSDGGWRESSRDSDGRWRNEQSWDSDGGWRDQSRDSGRGWKESGWDSDGGWRNEQSWDSNRGWTAGDDRGYRTDADGGTRERVPIRTPDGGEWLPPLVILPLMWLSATGDRESSRGREKTTSYDDQRGLATARDGENCQHFELTAGHEYIRKLQVVELMINARNADPMLECEIACSRSSACSAMIVDTVNRRCWQLEVRKLDIESDFRDQLTARPDISFVQKVCLRHAGCGAAYTFERVLHQELRVREAKLLADVSRVECQEACLNEATFTCRSLNYDYERRECRLNTDDRSSSRQHLQSSTSTDYFENNCAGQALRRPGNSDFVYRSRDLDRDTAFARREGPIQQDDDRIIPPRENTPRDEYHSRDEFIGGDGQFSGGNQQPADFGSFGGSTERDAGTTSFEDPAYDDRRYQPDTRDRYPDTRDRNPDTRDRQPDSGERTDYTGTSSADQGRGSFGGGQRHDNRGGATSDTTNSDFYPGESRHSYSDEEDDRDSNKNMNRYPDEDRDNDPSTDTYPYPDENRYNYVYNTRYPDTRDRYPDTNRDRYPDTRDRYPDTRDRNPDTNRDRYPDTRDRYPGTRDRYPDTRDSYPDTRDRNPGTRDRYPDTRDRNPDTRDRNPDTNRDRYPDTRDRYPDTRDRYPDTRDRNPDTRDRYPDTRDRYPDTNRDRYPDTNRDRYPDTTDRNPDTRDRYPDTRDRYPDTRDRFPDTRDRYPDTRDRYPDTRDRYPDTNRDRYPDRPRDDSRGPTRGAPRHDVRRCPEQPTFEKLVNMRYEPGGRASPGPRMERGGTMTALRQCARDPDCLSVGVEYQGDSEMFQKLQHSPSTEDRGQLVRDERCAFFVKVCLSGVEDMCSGLWAFDRVPDMALRGHNDIVTDWVSSREECQELCLKNVQLPCRSAEYSVGFLTCVQSRESRRTRPEDFEVSEGTEYLENQCAPVETDCEFQDTVDKFLPYSDRRITGVAYKEDCERQCNGERAFNCKSFSYSSRREECSLSSEDAAILPRIELESAPGMVFSQQTDCESVRVECNEREMVVTLQFGRPFEGRVFALGGPQTCFSVGDGRSRLQLAIPMDSRRCGTEQEGRTLFVNHVVVQNHPLITQQADRTVRVECRLEAQDQVISLPHSELGDAGVQVASARQSTPEEVVSDHGEAPNVALRLLRQGTDARPVLRAELGDPLYFVILAEQDTAFGMFGKSVEARTANGERLLLIDERGCATDPEIFSNLDIDRRTGNLVALFKAFRFPSTSKVNFVATIGFCQGECPPAQCGELKSMGRRRRRSAEDPPSSSSIVFTTEVSTEAAHLPVRNDREPAVDDDTAAEVSTVIIRDGVTNDTSDADTDDTKAGVSRHSERARGSSEEKWSGEPMAAAMEEEDEEEQAKTEEEEEVEEKMKEEEKITRGGPLAVPASDARSAERDREGEQTPNSPSTTTPDSVAGTEADGDKGLEPATASTASRQAGDLDDPLVPEPAITYDKPEETQFGRSTDGEATSAAWDDGSVTNSGKTNSDHSSPPDLNYRVPPSHPDMVNSWQEDVPEEHDAGLPYSAEFEEFGEQSPVVIPETAKTSAADATVPVEETHSVDVEDDGAEVFDDDGFEDDADDALEDTLNKPKLFDVLSQSMPLTATLMVGPDDDELETVLEERDLRGEEAAARGRFPSLPYGARDGRPADQLCAPRLTLALSLLSLCLGQLGLLFGGVWAYRIRRQRWFRRHRPQRVAKVSVHATAAAVAVAAADEDDVGASEMPSGDWTSGLHSGDWAPGLQSGDSWRYEDTGEDSCGPGIGDDCCRPTIASGGGGRGGGAYNSAQWLEAAR